MILHKGQVFRFRGREAAARAQALERELQGSCKRIGSQLEMIETRSVKFFRIGESEAGVALPLQAQDFLGNSRSRTIGIGKNGDFR